MLRRRTLQKELRALASLLDPAVDESIITAAALRLALERGVEIGDAKGLGPPRKNRGDQVVTAGRRVRTEEAEIERLSAAFPRRKTGGLFTNPQTLALDPFHQLDDRSRQAAEGPPGILPARPGRRLLESASMSGKRQAISDVPGLRDRLLSIGHLETAADEKTKLPASGRPVLAQVG